MKKRLLHLAFYACIIDALICLPYFIASVYLSIDKTNHNELLFFVMTAIYSIMSLVILFGMYILVDTILKSQHYLYLLKILIVTTAISLFAIPLTFIDNQLISSISSWILMITTVIGGIAYIYLFIKTKSIESALQPQWRTFSKINIVIGISMASIVLSPLAFLLNIASSIYGAILFKKSLKIIE